MPYDLPSVLKCCSVGSADLIVLGSSGPHSYFCCFSYSQCFGLLEPLLYNDFCYACWDAGIACLAFLAFDQLLLISAYQWVSVVNLAVISGYL